MRIVTLNLASGRDGTGRSLQESALITAVESVDGDLVVVQEVDTGQPRSHGMDQPVVLAAALAAVDWRSAATVNGTPGDDRPWRPVEPVALRVPGDADRGPRYGVAVFSRVPVRRWHVLGLPAGRARLPVPGAGPRSLRWFPDEPRVAVAAELDGLTVIGTHLSFAPHTAAQQLLRIRAWARRWPGPVVLAGDLNLAGPLPGLVTGGRRLVSAATFPARDPVVQLDHVLSLAGVVGSDAQVRQLPVGDHRCVAVTVRPGGGSEPLGWSVPSPTVDR